MELTEYFSRIWRRKWIVLGVIVLAVGITIAVMVTLPRQYMATATLESGGIRSYLAQPGQPISRTGRDLPSAIAPLTQIYLKLLQSPAVLNEARNRVKNSGTYSVDTTAEFVLNSNSDIIYIDVKSNDPAVAKDAADKLAGVIMEKSRETASDQVKAFIDDIQKNQIDPINKRLAEVRSESEKLKATPGDAADRTAKIAGLADEAKTLEDTREQYTDMIARVNVNLALDTNNLRLMAPAIMPAERQQPNLIRSGFIASVVGLFVGGIGVAFVDRKKQPVAVF